MSTATSPGMYFVRPAEMRDIPGLLALSAVATQGVHTLPRSEASLSLAVQHSMASFAAEVDTPSDESYFLILQNSVDGTLVGAAAINATAGAAGTFFAFRNDVIQQVSRDLNISHSVHALTLCSDLSGASQLSSFYVHDAEVLAAEAAMLSRARLLFAALAPHRFGESFFASLAGMTDSAGRSPFWEALGRKFFQMDFLDAERTIEGARNRTLIVELMPHYPVYVPLLPGDAQAAMGQVHAEGELPFKLLSDEGFLADEYVDIFDGGPILQAHKSSLRSIASAMRRRAVSGATEPALLGTTSVSQTYLIASTNEQQFRTIQTRCAALELRDEVVLTPELMAVLGIAEGELVLCVKL